MANNNKQQCGFCAMVSALLRRALCVGSRRSSSDSYYRELGDQDTLEVDDPDDDIENIDADHLREVLAMACEMNAELCNLKMHRRLSRFFSMRRRNKRFGLRTLFQELGLLDGLLPGNIQCILNKSAWWTFNAFTLDSVSGGRSLTMLGLHLFNEYGLIKHFDLDMVNLWKLFTMIEDGYHSTNPYHNAVHATDVAQAMHCFLQQPKIRDYLEPAEIMASIIAAMAHDIDHPGVSQPFLIAISSHLAKLYKNQSVLENHHWRTALSCVAQSKLLEDVKIDLNEFKSQISSLILATDITRQQEYLSQFKAHLDENTLDMTKKEHRHLVLQIALKCADISNPCRSWDISHKWSLKVCEEFFRQGDCERAMNLPVTPLCDRETMTIPRIQTGFFKFVVTPLMAEWHRFLQSDLSAEMLENLSYNQAQWELLVLQEIAAEESNEISDADMVDDDLETGSVNNDSAELLLPRRSSLNPIKQEVKEQLRRLSVPWNMFQNTPMKSDEAGNKAAPAADCACGQDDTARFINSQMSLQVNLQAAQEDLMIGDSVAAESSIISITTAEGASRLKAVLNKKGPRQLVRQQTFPPPQGARWNSIKQNSLFTCEIQPDQQTQKDKTDDVSVPRREATEQAEPAAQVELSENVNESSPTEAPGITVHLEKENLAPVILEYTPNRRESAPAESIVDNTAEAASQPSAELLQPRRRSVPADIATYAPKEKKLREMAAAISNLLRRTLSVKDGCPQRRGSAPAPLGNSELRGLVTLSALRQSINGGRRKANATCQWFSKVPGKSVPTLARRSSLPIEIMLPPELIQKAESN